MVQRCELTGPDLITVSSALANTNVLNRCTLRTLGLIITPSTLVPGVRVDAVVLVCKLVSSVVDLETDTTPGILIKPDSTVPGVRVDAVVLVCKLVSSVVDLETDTTPGAKARPITIVSAMILCFSYEKQFRITRAT